MKGGKIYSLIVTICFIGIIGFPAIDNIFYLTKDKSKRDSTAVFPEIDIALLDPVPKQLETYFDKTYLLKEKLVRMNSIIKLQMLNISPTVMTVVGKEGWLYWGERIMDDYRCTKPFTKAEVDTITDRLHRRALWLHARGIKFYFAVAPLKHNVYPEFISTYAARVGKQSRLEQITEALKHDTLIRFIEVHSSVMEGKKKHQVYHKTDNHWNAYGAYYAYRNIAERVKKDFPLLKPLELDAFKPDTLIRKGGGSDAHFINLPELFEDQMIYMHPKFTSHVQWGAEKGYAPPKDFVYPNDYEIVTVNDSAKLGTALFIRDSFSDMLLPYMKEHFKKGVYIFDAWQYKENRYIIEQEKPEAVFLVVWEGNLRNFAMDFEDYRP